MAPLTLRHGLVLAARLSCVALVVVVVTCRGTAVSLRLRHHVTLLRRDRPLLAPAWRILPRQNVACSALSFFPLEELLLHPVAVVLRMVLVDRRFLGEVAGAADLDWVVARAAGVLHLLLVFANGRIRALSTGSWTHQALVGADHAAGTLDEGVARRMTALAVARRRAHILAWLLPVLTVGRWLVRRLTLGHGLRVLLWRTPGVLRLRERGLHVVVLAVGGRTGACTTLWACLPLLSRRSLLDLAAGMPLVLASKSALLLRIGHLRLVVAVVALLRRLQSLPWWLVFSVGMAFLVLVSLLELLDLLGRHLTPDLLLLDYSATTLIRGSLRLDLYVAGLVFLLKVGREGVVARLRLRERILLLRGVLLTLGKVSAGLARELPVGGPVAQRSGSDLLILVAHRPRLRVLLSLTLGLLMVCFAISLHILLLLFFSRWHATRLVSSLRRPLNRTSLTQVVVARSCEVVLPSLLILALLLQLSLPELLLDILLVRLHYLDAGKLAQVVELELGVALASTLGVDVVVASCSTTVAGTTRVRGSAAFAHLSSVLLFRIVVGVDRARPVTSH